MEEDLAVGLFDHGIHVAAVGVVTCSRGGLELALNGAVVSGEIAHPTVLRAERVPKERDGHGVRRE